MDNINLPEKIIAVVIIFIMIFVVGFAGGTFNGENKLKLQAIKEHKAHYEVNEVGEPVFTWNK